MVKIKYNDMSLYNYIIYLKWHPRETKIRVRIIVWNNA